MLPIILVRPMAWPMVALLLMFCMGYYIQRRLYANVVEAMRARLHSKFPRRFVDIQ